MEASDSPNYPTVVPKAISSIYKGSISKLRYATSAILILCSLFAALLSTAPKASALTPVTAPSFTVARGSATLSLSLSIPARTGSPTFTVKVYSSSDSYSYAIYTKTGYSSGADLYDSTADNCSGGTPLCYATRRSVPLRFTITPEPISGYSSNGESEQSDVYAVLSTSVVSSFSALRNGPVVGFSVIFDNRVNPVGGNATLRAYRSDSGYTTITDTATLTYSGTQNFPLASANGIHQYKFESRAESFMSSSGIKWLASDWKIAYAFGFSVYVKPNPPSNVAAVPITGGSILVSWDTSAGGDQNYNVYLSIDGSSWTYSSSTGGNNLVINGLTPGTPYYIKVNNYGSGAAARYSEDVLLVGTVTPAAVPGDIGSLSITNGNAITDGNHLVVSWTPPSNDGGSAITGYVINWSTTVGIWIDSVTVSASETSTKISGLTFGANYYVRIAAQNSHGIGTYSSAGPQLLVGTPNSLVQLATSVTTTSAVLSVLVDAQGISTVPSITYGPVGGASTTVFFDSTTVSGRMESVTVTGLTPGTLYSVIADLNPGLPDWRGITFTTTPSVLTDVTSTATKNSVALSWLAFPRAPGTGFRYSAWAEVNGVQQGIGCASVTIISNNRSSCTITGLTPGTSYQIRITSTIQYGDSGNGTSAPYLLNLTTASNVAVVSLSVAGNTSTATFRSPLELTALISTPGKITFSVNGKAIPGCKGRASVSSYTCTWKPSFQGSAIVTATLVPTDSAYLIVGSRSLAISVSRRSGLR